MLRSAGACGRLAGLVLIAACAAALIASPAQAAPHTPEFGALLDEYPDYEGQSTCDPDAEPGVLAFMNIVLAEYPSTTSLGIGRECHIGGQSEHKEGRAWDWGADVGNSKDKAAVDDLLDWLLKEDKYDNKKSRLRRFGIMYLIWNKRIWTPWDGWETYCEMRSGVCRDPDDGSSRSPHTDHVHFSFAWAGARQESSWWNEKMSMLAGLAPHPLTSGYWAAGRNGDVVEFGSSLDHGRRVTSPENTLMAIASTPTGNGYWLAMENGGVRAKGDAKDKGDANGETSSVVDIEGTPTGLGYWLVTKRGRIFEFGDAASLGTPNGEDARIVDMESTPSGLGYWVFAKDGRVFEFGDAIHHGDARGMSLTSEIAGAAAHGPGGYWLVTKTGQVIAFGDAGPHGSVAGGSEQPIVGMAATATGNGYWLLNKMGKVRAFGDAAALGSVKANSIDVGTPREPAGFEVPEDHDAGLETLEKPDSR